MYEAFYGLDSSPFLLTPDVRFFYESRQHARAIAHLSFGLAQGEGFVIVTGEVGAGKTTLIERLWSQLDRNTFSVARVSTTQLSSDDLFRMAMAGFGIAADGAGKAASLERFAQLLHEHRLAGRRCLLVVDEAQSLSLGALEELRMLSNLTEEGRCALQTILLGQPQFRRMLASPELDQLRQRVLASYHLGPLGQDDTKAYVEHRLRTAGWKGDNPAWDDDAFSVVHCRSGGVPRRINRLCGRVMIYGALEHGSRITADIVESTADELDQDLEAGGARRAGGSGSPLDLDGAGRDGGLLIRVERLELQMARRERVFQRLLDAFGIR